MPQVQLAPDFFIKERDQNYANWQLAFWRELFQNAIDQEVDRIDIGMVQRGSIVEVTFSDNGPGMTRQVLNDVYFNIGASTKDNDPTKIGGMGRARILTCFSMQSYSIFSQDYAVTGNGAWYDVTNHTYTFGCKLVIAVGSDLATMRQELDNFLGESRVSAAIYINGERRPYAAMHPGKHVRDLETNGTVFARVWVNKSAPRAQVYVRVNGVSMFTNGTNAKAQIIVELEPSLSRSVLTSNRDGLRWQYRQALDAFLLEIAVNTNSGLRSKFDRKTTVSNGGGLKTIALQPKAKKTKAKKSEINADLAAILAAPMDSFRPAAFAPTQPMVEDLLWEKPVEVLNPFKSWLDRTFGNIYLFDETTNKTMRKSIVHYDPATWITNRENNNRRGTRIIQVLLLWHTAITYALEISLRHLRLDRITYGVGFVFPTEETIADHRQINGAHVFSVRPVDMAGKLSYSINNRRDRKRLMALAKHEVTHILHDWHGEEFSSAREEIDIDFDEAECFARMKQALARAQV